MKKSNGDFKMKQNNLFIFFALLVVCGVFLLTGCATTEQTKEVETSGFLGDYSQLKKGGGERALLYYVNPNANLAAYDKLIIDPITIWHSKDSDLSKVPKEELENLTHYLYSAVRKQLESDYTIIEQPAKGAMRIRMALTEAEGSIVPLDIATTYLPPARLISEAKKLATGTHSFVGETAIEMEILDSMSKERLVAAVDERAGGKHYKGSTDTWADVKQAADFWAERIKTRLTEYRSK